MSAERFFTTATTAHSPRELSKTYENIVSCLEAIEAGDASPVFIQDLERLGMTAVALGHIGHDSSAVRSGACSFLASFFKHSYASMNQFLSQGGVPPLSQCAHSDPDAQAQYQALSALSALVRNNEVALSAYVQSGMIDQLLQCIPRAEIRLQRRGLVLLCFLMENAPSQASRIIAFGPVKNLFLPLLEVDDVDIREKALEAIAQFASLSSACAESLNDDALFSALEVIRASLPPVPEFLMEAVHRPPPSVHDMKFDDEDSKFDEKKDDVDANPGAGVVNDIYMGDLDPETQTSLEMSKRIDRIQQQIRMWNQPGARPEVKEEAPAPPPVEQGLKFPLELLSDERRRVGRQEFDASFLVSCYPPECINTNKKVLFALSLPADGDYGAAPLVFSRWDGKMLSEAGCFPTAQMTCSFDHQQDAYSYGDSPDGEFHWHVNFADSKLFYAYGSPLMAQDEIQVAEHPVLASLREALVEMSRANQYASIKPLTLDGQHATPCLIRNVQRRIQIDLAPNAAAGRPQGLYGNEFWGASEAAVASAVTVLNPPTTSHIIAMAALGYGKGKYTRAQIETTLATVYTSFRAARIEAYRHAVNQQLAQFPTVVIHTGNWGAGAFGGDGTLMTLVQMLAGSLAGVDRLFFHTFDDKGTRAFQSAINHFQNLWIDHANRPLTTAQLVEKLVSMNFMWGVSNRT